jgi:tetratricopeptide (TPR) repeat protein
MDNSNQEEEKNSTINKKFQENNPINNDNNKSNSLSESMSGSNSYNEKDDQISKLKNQLNFLIETLNYEQAIILCKKILFFTPDDPQIYQTLSNLYLKIYDISSSITCLKKILLIAQNSPDFMKLKVNLKDLYFCKGLLESQSSGKLENDVDLLSHINNNGITLNDYLFLRAKSFLILGNVKEGIEDINKILENDHQNDRALVLLAKVLSSQGKEKEGASLMWKAYKINPNNPEAKTFTKTMKKLMDEVLKEANLNVLKGRYKTGLLLSVKALKIYPNHPEALLLRSSIFKSLGKYNESIMDLNKALMFSNETSDEIKEMIKNSLNSIYNDLSLEYLNTNNCDLAMKFINNALQINPEDVIAHFNKGDCYLKLKDIINAKEEYITCLEIDENFNDAKLRLSTVFYKLAILSYNSKDYDEALQLLNESIKYYGGNDIIHVLRARTYLKLDRIKEAYEDAVIAYMINPKNQDAIEIKKILN